MPLHPAQARGRQDDHQQKLDTLQARLHDAAQALRTCADWAACLRLAALLPGEDFANIVLINAQRPGATQVRDYRQWTAAGRQVRKGEIGLAVFGIPPPPAGRARRPGEDDDEPGPVWRDADRVTYLWDLSQTTGPPVSGAFGPPRDPPARVWDALCWLARRQGYAVEREHGPPPDGTIFWTARRIRIPPQLTDEQAVRALAHQLGHVLLHHDLANPAGTTTADCTGVHRAEAESVAWITCTRHGITPASELPYPASWAGNDPRAQPAAAILAAGQRISMAATRITTHTTRILHGDEDSAPTLTASPGLTTPTRHPGAGKRDIDSAGVSAPVTRPAASQPDEPDEIICRVLADAQAFYTRQLDSSWALGYLQARGITPAAIQDWHIGYAPAGWTALTGHLRRLGHHDDTIQAAGLATPSSRGTLIDRFRDRIMLPVHDAAGMLAGFTGRARPDAGPDVPKYLNSPETAAYKKSHLLFGLHQALPALARGAVPVIVEGPFDAIAITIADPGRHAGLAPCGTALTSQQAALLSQAADLTRTGIIVAFDSDMAGRKAAIRANGILRPLTGKLQTVTFDGKDPAEILQRDGPNALRCVLRDQRQPLSALLIDASIEQWARRLNDLDGPLMAMRSTARLIASMLPDDTASQIRDITAGRELHTTDDLLRPADNPEIPQIARILPADTSYQIVRTAGKLGLDCTDVLAEVANATTRSAGPARHQADTPHNHQGRGPAAPQPSATWLASTSFPRRPPTLPASPEPSPRHAATAIRRPSQLAR